MDKLGKMIRITDLRSVWPHEANDFTRWLAQEENLTLLKVTTLHAKNIALQDKDTTLHAKNEALQDKDTTLHACCVHSTKMSREKLQELILEYCIEWRSAEEIATYVHRSKQYIRGEILPSMDQLLIRKYPLKEKHPGQKYKVRER